MPKFSREDLLLMSRQLLDRSTTVSGTPVEVAGISGSVVRTAASMLVEAAAIHPSHAEILQAGLEVEASILSWYRVGGGLLVSLQLPEGVELDDLARPGGYMVLKAPARKVAHV